MFMVKLIIFSCLLIFFIPKESDAFFNDYLFCLQKKGKWNWVEKECTNDNLDYRDVGCRESNKFFSTKTKKEALDLAYKKALSCATERCFQRDGLPVDSEPMHTLIDWIKCSEDRYNRWICNNTVYINCKFN